MNYATVMIEASRWQRAAADMYEWAMTHRATPEDHPWTAEAQQVAAHFSRRSRECLFTLIGDGTGA